MPAVAVYARASLDRTERRISVSRQVERCRKLVEDRWPGSAVTVFEDNNLSGSDPQIVRPGFDALLAAIQRGDVEQVVAHEQSRLTRQPSQWDALVVAMCRSRIPEVHTVQQGSIPVAPGARILGRVMAVVDADESERIKLRALAMHEQLALEGRPNGGRYYGLQRVYGTDRRPSLQHHPDEVPVVRRICAQLAAGVPAGRVADELTEEGVPTGRGGRRWWSQTVLNVARRPHVAGLRSHNGRLVAAGTWEPIIPREHWERLQVVINSRRTGVPRPRRWLLSGGLAVCAKCGTPMTAAQQPRPRLPGGYVTVYACSVRSWVPGACGSVSLGPADLIEQIVSEAFFEAVDSPRFAALLGRDNGAARRAAERMTTAEARVARAAELFGQGEINEDTWRRMHAPAHEEATRARLELERLSGAGVHLPPAGSLRSGWGDMTLAQRRVAVGRVIDKVLIKPRTAQRPADQRVRILGRLELMWRV